MFVMTRLVMQRQYR